MDVFEERKARLATADNMRASIAMHHVTKGGEFLRAGEPGKGTRGLPPRDVFANRPMAAKDEPLPVRLSQPVRPWPRCGSLLTVSGLEPPSCYRRRSGTSQAFTGGSRSCVTSHGLQLQRQALSV